MKRGLITLFTFFFVGGFCQEMSETKIQGLFLYHFTKYIEWPEKAAITVGVIGDKAVYDEVSLRFARNNAVNVVFYNKPEQAAPAELLYVGTLSSGDLEHLQARLDRADVVYVSYRNGMAHKGSTINFVMKEGRMKFELNQQNIASSGVKVSSELKKLAILV